MKIAITILGEKREFQSSIVVDGEKGSILYADGNSIIGRIGKATVNISEESRRDSDHAKCSCSNAKQSECF